MGLQFYNAATKTHTGLATRPPRQAMFEMALESLLVDLEELLIRPEVEATARETHEIPNSRDENPRETGSEEILSTADHRHLETAQGHRPRTIMIPEISISTSAEFLEM